MRSNRLLGSFGGHAKADTPVPSNASIFIQKMQDSRSAIVGNMR
ncbi:hypothetical protein [Cohnella rhizosphaerae]|uniref:Uncharacterized protein n=1 Tax=Cohnella rhizosphaerae TaxID=1457232 RepID=A0A9X4KTS1_9BACL|nr:hypothetical protein [Cohnella rhizosphaerae]MDG0810752.1 hypothetical protein [Cohnella rhizosphaerae]